MKRALIVLFVGVLVTLTWILPAHAGKNFPWYGLADGFTIWLAETPIEMVPPTGPGVPSSGMTGEEFMAYIADHGNRMSQHIRNTQGQYYWYRGFLEPIGSDDEQVVWPAGQHFALQLADDTIVPASEVVGMSGFDIKMVAVPMVTVYPQHGYATFRQLLYTHPQHQQYIVYVAFPRSYDPDSVVRSGFVSSNLLTANQGGPK